MADKKTLGLILPADNPPRRSSIKRQLLFFDSILIPAENDVALINEFEISETFPNGMTIQWAHRTPFPRSADYEDTIKSIKSETEAIQKKGHIRFLPLSNPSIDPGANWFIYHNAISNSAIVQAAVPEANDNPPSIPPANGVYTGSTISVGGYKSKYEFEAKPAYNLIGEKP